MSELSKFEEITSHVEQAWLAHTSIYSKQYPPPAKGLARHEKTDTWLLYGLGVVLLGSVIVSASHTIPTFVKQDSLIGYAVAISAFVMVEMAIIVMAFFTTRTSGHTDLNRVKRLANRGMWFVILIALLANLHHQLAINGFATVRLQGDTSPATIWELFSFGISVSVALCAPTMAFISGDVLAMMQLYRASAQVRLDSEYEQKYSEWNVSLNESWTRNKANYGATIKVERPSMPRLADVSIPTDRQDKTDNRQTGYGYSRNSNAVDTARQWLIDNPSQANLPVRQLAEMIGVGKDSVAKARASLD